MSAFHPPLIHLLVNIILRLLEILPIIRVTGLNPLTTYYYRIRASNSAGSSTNSNTINVITLQIITTVQFNGIAEAVTKTAGTYDLTLSITNPDNTNATTCLINYVADSSSAAVSYIANYTPATVTFPAGSSLPQKVTLTLLNNGVSERSKRAYFRIENVNGGSSATAGTQSYFYLTIMSGKDNAYYSSINSNLTGTELKNALYNLIKGNIKFPYSDNTTDVWNILQDADEDPHNPSNVIGIYSGLSIYKYNTSLGLWNREHIWSKSHGNFGTEIGAGTDAHHLRAENANVNTLKNNLDFDNGRESSTKRPRLFL